MSKITKFALLLLIPSAAVAQDFHQGGFFDSDVSQSGFFTEDQAGIPIKNNTGMVTRNKKDSWEVPPEKVAGMVTAEAKVTSDKQAKEQTGNTDSFEVKKESSD